MIQMLLIGVGAGVVATLMFAALASGSLLAVALFYLAPLPILIATLGWGPIAGLLAALTGSMGLLASFNAVFAVVFLLGAGLPAWWLGYIGLLARPAPAEGSEQLEWYPIGRLVFWAAILGAFIVAAAIPQFGMDAESFRAALKGGFERVFQTQTGAPADGQVKLPGVSDSNLVFELFAVIIPPAAAALTTTTLLVNLWLAGHVVRLSGRLRRPWPDLSKVALPNFAAATFALAFAGSFLPGMIGIVAGLFAASLSIAYVAHGLSVLHALTAKLNSRPIILTGVYAAILIFGWPLAAMALLGLADTLLNLRGRQARKSSSPSAPSSKAD